MRRGTGWAAAAILAASLVACAGGSKAVNVAARTPVAIPVRTVSFTLKNGLTVVLDEDHSAPTVSLDLSYRVGGRDDPPRRSGFAHLFEHLMFDGSKNVASGAHERLLAAAGARGVNAHTWLDRTSYVETFPSDSLELALWLESDRMGFLLDRLDQESLDKERAVVKNERRQRYENAPAGLVDGILQAELYPEPHPYHRTTIGSPEDLDRAALDDVRAYFRGHYMPSNATLVLVGDLEPSAARALVTKYFEPLPSEAAPERDPAPAQPPPGDRRVRVEANVDDPRVIVAWRTPPALSEADARIDVVLPMLAGGQGSLLYRWLVEERGFARNVVVRYEAWQLGGMARIDVTLRKGASPDEVLGVIDNALADSRYTRISVESVNAATTQETSRLVFSLESLADRAAGYAVYRELTGSPVFIERHIGLYNGIRARDVAEVKATLLARDQRVVAFVTPSRSAPVGGRLAGGLEVGR